MNGKSKTDKDRLADAEEILRQKLTIIRNQEREIKLIKRDNDAAEKIRTEIYDLKAQTPSPPSWISALRPAKSPGIPCAILSDIHGGEKVFKDQLGGANEYDLKIMVKRLRLWASVLLDLTFNHMVNPDYPGLVLMFGGDMITGMLHDDLRETNDGPVQRTLLLLQEELISIIQFLLTKFDRIFIPAVVGNHGRETPKPRAKNRVFTSYEWNLYCQLELFFRNEKRVQFFIPHEADAYFSVQGHRYLFTHGDSLGVKGGDGIIGILGPVARGTIKVAGQSRQIGRDFDTLTIGHGHTYIPRSAATACIMNGCVIGYNEYAHLMLRVPFSRPTQALWFTHSKYGITAQWPMYLDPGPKPKAQDWITWNDRRD
jgi:hypothetical protein